MEEHEPVFAIEHIESGKGTMYADTAEAAFAAYHQMHRDIGIKGTRVGIRNLITEKVIWSD